MAEPFKLGDLVKLKSGGPRMTVIGVGVSGQDAHAELKSAGLDLTRYSDDQLQAIEEFVQVTEGAAA